MKKLIIFPILLFIVTEITLGFRTNITFFFFLVTCFSIAFVVRSFIISKTLHWKTFFPILPTQLLLMVALSLWYIDKPSFRINTDLLFEMLFLGPLFYVLGLIFSFYVKFVKIQTMGVMLSFVIAVASASLISFVAMPYYFFHYESQISMTDYPKSVPIFMAKNLQNQTYNSQELKGKVILLDFFNTRCGFCIMQLDEVQAIKKEFSNRDDFEVLVVSTGGVDSLSSLSKFLLDEDDNIKALKFILDEDDKIWNQFKLKALPTTCLIDKNGKIVFWHESYYNGQDNYQAFMSKKIQNLLH